jgi:hypothetical protein
LVAQEPCFALSKQPRKPKLKAPRHFWQMTNIEGSTMGAGDGTDLIQSLELAMFVIRADGHETEEPFFESGPVGAVYPNERPVYVVAAHGSQ